MAHHEHRPPGAGIEKLDRPVLGKLLREFFLLLTALEKALQQRQDGLDHVAATEIGDDLLSDVSLFAHRRDDADVLVDRAGGTSDVDGANEHDA